MVLVIKACGFYRHLLTKVLFTNCLLLVSQGYVQSKLHSLELHNVSNRRVGLYLGNLTTTTLLSGLLVLLCSHVNPRQYIPHNSDAIIALVGILSLDQSSPGTVAD